jgi:TPR repeat protein
MNIHFNNLLFASFGLLLTIVSYSVFATEQLLDQQDEQVQKREALFSNDLKKTLSTNQQSEEQGDALYKKAEAYLHIAETQNTYGLAIQNYQKASDLGHKQAKAKLAFLKTYLPNELSLKKRYRRELIKAKEGDAQAQYDLAEMCEFGLGVDQNLKRAINWYKAAAVNNHGKAQNRLGDLYLKGLISDQNAVTEMQALQWIQTAAENNQAEAQFKLGSFYLNGEQVEKNIDQAFYWFEKSAKNDHIQGKMQTGFMLKTGNGVKRNYEKALFWFEKAAAQGFEPANVQVDEVNTILDDIFLRNFEL